MLGIVCEGGASRTIYSCGVLDALLDEEIIADYLVGTSAGIAFGVSYCSHQRGRNRTLAEKYMGRPEYSGFRHLLDPKCRSYYDPEFVYGKVPQELLPFDWQAFREYKGRAVACVTNIRTGKAEYLDCPRDDERFLELQASCALPLLSPPIEIGGELYLDGGIADSIPYKRALEEGCDRLIVILTRPRGYVKKNEPVMKLAERSYKKYPELVEAMRTRAERYNRCTAELEELRQQGKAFVFSPKTTFGISRTEGDPEKLLRLYSYGERHGKHAMEQLKRYISKPRI